MSNERERVISVTLSEAEWQAFVTRHPQPVVWLKERIRNEVEPSAPAGNEVNLVRGTNPSAPSAV